MELLEELIEKKSRGSKKCDCGRPKERDSVVCYGCWHVQHGTSGVPGMPPGVSPCRCPICTPRDYEGKDLPPMLTVSDQLRNAHKRMKKYTGKHPSQEAAIRDDAYQMAGKLRRLFISGKLVETHDTKGLYLK